jgi:hypothetical protein
MNLCGSNLIPICITLVCCAGLFMYFNSRLNDVKVAVEKQNRVLTSFISSVQQDIKGGGGACQAAPEALVAAKQFAHQIDDKIVVSDDEEDDDSDSESDSESEDEDDFEGEDDHADDHTDDQSPPPPILFEVLPLFVSESASSSEPFTSSITEVTNEPSLALAEDVSYEQMKVDDLRKIVADKNLATKDEVKKLKKPELLILLKKV